MASYTFKKGDSLLQIAKDNGISYDSLLAANPGIRGGVQPGVTLRVPTIQTHPDFQPGDVDPRLPGRQAPAPVFTPPPAPPGRRGGQPVVRGRPQPPIQPQTPVVRFTGAQPLPTPRLEAGGGGVPLPPVPRADLAQYNVPRRTGFVPPQTRRPGEPTAGARFADPSNTISAYLARLFRSQPPVLRRPGEPTTGARFAPSISQETIGAGLQGLGQQLQDIRSQAELVPGAYSFAEGFPRGDPLARGPGDVLAPGTSARLPGSPPEAIADAEVDPVTGSNIRYRMMLADGSVGRSQYVAQMRPGDFNPDGSFTDEAIARYEQSRADDVYRSLQRGEWPQVMTESDRLLNGWSKEWMAEHGYYYDEDKGYWSAGQQIEDAPQTVGAALPYSGYGYGYGGGGPRYSYPKGGGGTYTPYFDYTQPGARGQIPQQIQNRPARFGMVSWRI